MSSSSNIIWLSLHHHLTWCHHQPITSSWNLSTIVSWSSSTFWALPEYQLNSWWEIPPLPLYDLCYHRQHYCLPSDTNLIMLWSSLLSSLFYLEVLLFLMSRMLQGWLPLLRILVIVMPLAITLLLVPVLLLTGIPISEICHETSVLFLATLLFSS